VDCKASAGLQDGVVATPDHVIWSIGGSQRWDPLRGDPTSVANRLVQGEWYSRDADIYRAAAERYLLWLVQTIDLARLQRTPERVFELLEPSKLLSLLRELRSPEAARLSTQIHGLGQFEREGVAGFRARFGLVVEGITGQNLGPGLTLEDEIQAGRTGSSASTPQPTRPWRRRSAPGSCSTWSVSPRSNPAPASSSSTSSRLSDGKAGTSFRCSLARERPA